MSKLAGLANPTAAFLHSLGQTRKSRRSCRMSVLALRTEIQRPLRYVRLVPNPDMADTSRAKKKAARRRLIKFKPDDRLIRHLSMLALTSGDRP
jgi:hypothetical protein